jgi:hypothetical protein
MKLRTLQQNATIKGASPAELFDLFVSPEKHGKLIGAKVTGNGKQGSKFTAFDGFVTGVNLVVVPNRLLVQSWRGNVWKEGDLEFEERWDEFYWQPLKKLFSQKRPPLITQ